MKRHTYIEKSTLDKFKRSSSKNKANDKQTSNNQKLPLFKLFGCLLQEDHEVNKVEEFDDDSSDSDIEDHY